MWLAAQPRGGGQTITAETHRQRMRTVRQFFERVIEWGWPGTPPRNPVIAWDIPKKPEPLLKFLGDRDAARLMAAARSSTDPRDQLVVELLARTGCGPASWPTWTPMRWCGSAPGTGFGALNASAEIRRDVLAALLPKLAIAGRCALAERFLVVRGDLRTYRIHLRSANILLLPVGNGR